MSNHFPLEDQPFRTLYYVRGDQKALGGSSCVCSKGKSGYNEQLDWARESDHNPRLAEPIYGNEVKTSLRPHADRTSIVGGVTQEAHALRYGDTAVQRSAGEIKEASPKKSLLVQAFQESRHFKQTTEQLKVAGRSPDKTTSADYGKGAYAVRAHVAVPWVAKDHD